MRVSVLALMLATFLWQCKPRSEVTSSEVTQSRPSTSPKWVIPTASYEVEDIKLRVSEIKPLNDGSGNVRVTVQFFAKNPIRFFRGWNGWGRSSADIAIRFRNAYKTIDDEGFRSLHDPLSVSRKRTTLYTGVSRWSYFELDRLEDWAPTEMRKLIFAVAPTSDKKIILSAMYVRINKGDLPKSLDERTIFKDARGNRGLLIKYQ